MNILLINHYAGSPWHGMEYRPFYMARYWQNSGHQVRIVAATFSHLRSKQPQVVDHQIERFDNVEYYWLEAPPYKGNGLKRVVNMVTFTAKLMRHSGRITEDFSPDVVIASSTYPLDIFPAYLIAKKFNARLIFEVHDLWPLSPMELGGMSKWHPFIQVMQFAENFAYRNSHKVVSMLPKAETHMREHGLAPGKFVYVPNGIDVDDWKASDESLPPHVQSRLDGIRAAKKFLVCYAGTHGVANALDCLIKACTHVPPHESFGVVLIGDGPEKSKLEQLASSLHLDNVYFFDHIPKRAIPALLAQMDALYVGFQNQPLFRFGVSPNKLMDYMMAGKPVIHAINAGNDLVAESGCGRSVEPENPEAVADAMGFLMEMTNEQRNLMGGRGQAYVTSNHSYNVLAPRFIKAMEG